MKCEQFETLLADALGDELSDADRPRFEGHLAVCQTCREEYRSTASAVARMRSLPGCDRVSEALDREAAGSRTLPLRPSRAASLLRYAAAVMVAFGAGYAFRGSMTTSATAHVGPPRLVQTAAGSQRTFGRALLGAHREQPRKSGLAKCMIAMFSSQG